MTLLPPSTSSESSALLQRKQKSQAQEYSPQNSMSCSEECSPKNFRLEYPTPAAFVNSQWRVPQVVYFIWRLVAAVFFTVWVIMSGAVDYDWHTSQSNRVKWFIYLTNWAFITLTINTLVEVVTVGWALLKGKDGSEENSMPWHYKMSWVLYNVATPTGVLVSIAFWALVYPNYNSCPSNEVHNACGYSPTPTCTDPSPASVDEACFSRCECPDDLPVWYGGECIELADCPDENATDTSTDVYERTDIIRLHYIDIGTHAFNTVYILINLCITAIPVRIQHFWHCLVFAVVYIVFSAIYDVAGGTNARDKGYIYSVLDWDEIQTTIIYAILVGIIAPIVLWFIVYGLYRLRIAIFRGCNCTNNHLHPDETERKDITLGAVETQKKYGTGE